MTKHPSANEEVKQLWQEAANLVGRPPRGVPRAASQLRVPMDSAIRGCIMVYAGSGNKTRNGDLFHDRSGQSAPS
jgi:hypothetical protein